MIKKSRKSLTLIEALLVIFLLAILFFIVNALFSKTRIVSKIKDWEVAMGLAMEAMEIARNYPFELLCEEFVKDKRLSLEYDFNNDDGDEEIDIFKPKVKINGVEYERKVVINPVPSRTSYNPLLCEIYIEVKWKDRLGHNVVYEVYGLISKK